MRWFLVHAYILIISSAGLYKSSEGATKPSFKYTGLTALYAIDSEVVLLTKLDSFFCPSFYVILRF